MCVKSKLDATSGGSLQAPYQGVQYVIATGADVINMSWGGPSYSATYQALFNLAYANGIVNVAAAGNSSTSAPMYPASYDHVISVGATDPSDAKASFSNFGATIDVMAPGSNIYSTLAGSNSSYGNLSGTSMASPLVAGLAGLMLSYDPTLDPDGLEDCLENTCDNINALNPNFIGSIGAGRINAREAMACLKPISAVFTEDFSQVCPGGQVQFTDQSTNMPTSWEWTFQGGTPATSTQQNPLVTYANPGNYDVTLIVHNTLGSDTLLQAAHITVALPTATLSGGANILAGYSASMSVAFTGNPPYDFTYNDGTNNVNVTGITQNPYYFIVSPTVTTTYTLTAMSDSLCNGTGSGSALVTVIQNNSCNGTSSYNRTYGGTGNDVGLCLDQTVDGGTIIGGYTNSFGAGGTDYYVLKLDACGNVEWDRTFGSSTDERVSAVEQTSDGNYIVCGYAYFNNGNNWSCWMLKLDQLGNILWSKSYGQSQFDYPRACTEMPNGNLVIAEVTAQGAGANDIGVIQTDPLGNVIWARSYGQNANEFIVDIQNVSTGGFIAHGYRRNYSAFRTMWLLRLDVNGGIVWQKEYTMNGNSIGNATVTELMNGQGFAATGYVYTGTNNASATANFDGFYIRTDLNGNVTQSRRYNGTSYDIGVQLIEKTNGNFDFLMRTESGGNGGQDIYLAEIDPAGLIVGGAAIGGGNDEIIWNASDKFQRTPNGNLVIAGQTASFGAGGNDVYVIKTNTAGIPPCDDAAFTMPSTAFPVVAVNLNLSNLLRSVSGINVNPVVIDPPTLEGINCSSAAPPPFCITVKGHQKISNLQGNFNAPLVNADQFGAAALEVGDINGDGVQDLAVSANLDDLGGVDRGAFYILLMNTNGTVQNYTMIGTNTGGFTGNLYNLGAMGSHLEPLGDLNGDGVPDLALGVSRDYDGGTMQGALFILFMNANGTVGSQQKISELAGNFTGALDAQDRFGNTITNIGDLNNDGVVDIAVAAPFDDDGGNETGAVWILFLNANGTVNSHAKISATSGGLAPGTLDPSDNFSTGVTSIGDYDGNGTQDLLVGARYDDDGGIDRGAVYILTLNPNGSVLNQYKISSTAGNFGPYLDNDDRFGISADNLGDLNGDGVNDVVVGSYRDDDGGADKGAAYILFLNNNGTVQGVFKISATAGGFTGVPDNAGNFAWAVSAIGDLDNNGMIDLAIGEPGGDDGGNNRGACWIIYLEDSCACQYGNMNTFQRWYGDSGTDEGHSVKKTLDGNIVMVGATTNPSAGQRDIFVTKADIYGNPIWSRTYGTVLDEYSSSLQILPALDGGYLITGATSDANGEGMLIIKTDANGFTTWVKRLDGAGLDRARAAAEVTGGGFVIGGTSSAFGAGSQEGHMFKLDVNGNLLWTRTIGGNLNDHVIDVEEAPNGDLIWAIHSRSYGLGTYTCQLLRTTANGMPVWDYIYDGPQIEYFLDLALTSDKGVVAIGRTESYGAGSGDIFLVKVDSAGTMDWARTYGGPQDEWGITVEATSDGGFILGGEGNSFGSGGTDIWGIKTDAQGNLDWAKTYGGTGTDVTSHWGHMVTQASDGGYYFWGSTNSFGVSSAQGYLIKTDVCGNSWCNETDITGTITVTSPTPSVSIPPSIMGTGGTVTNHTIVSNGFTWPDSILCAAVIPLPDSCFVMADFTADTVCFGDTTHFTDMTVDTGAVSYWEWDFGDGNGAVGQPNPSHLYGAPGSYQVTLVSGAYCFDTITKSILVIDTIGIAAPNDTTICLNDSVLLVPQVLGCGVPPYTFSWTPVAGLDNPNLETPTASPAATTTYTVTVTDANGNTANDQVTVTVDPNCCSVHASFTGDSLVCVGDFIQFTNTSNVGAALNPGYLWFNGPLTLPTSTSGFNPPPVQFFQPGMQQVRLMVQTTNCGTDTVWKNIYVNPLPTAFAGNDTMVCDGSTFMIGDSTLSYHTYSWSPAAGLSDPTIANPLVTINGNATYIVTITDDITGCVAMDTIDISILPNPGVSLPADTVVCQGQTYTVVPITANTTALQWNNNSNGPTLDVTTAGWVWLIGSNACGADTDSMYVDFIPSVSVDLGMDQTACVGDIVTLSPTVSGATSLLWSDGSTGATLDVTTTGWVWLIASNSCSADTDSVYIDFITPPTIDLGADQTVCEGVSATINAITTGGVGTIQWNDNSSGPSLTVNTTGWAWAIVTNVCGSDTDSVYVDVLPVPTVDLGPDQQGCAGDVITLNPVIANATLDQWSDNSTGTSLGVTQSGTYWVEVSNPQCGTVRDSVEITFLDPPTIALPVDTGICEGQSLLLTPVVTGTAAITWQDGSQANTFNVTQAGTYWAIASNSCGSDTDSVVVGISPPAIVTLGPDTTICDDDTLVLDPGNGFVHYFWQDGSGQPTYAVTQAGGYTVLVTDVNGCQGQAQIQIWTENCLRGLYVPNAFTPNNDQLNDVFQAVENGFTLQDLKVWDRWGKLIYQAYSVNDPWDGLFKGQPVQEGVYVWVIEYLDYQGNRQIARGTVTLYR
ncbi:UNVERIFIED_CONTAM: hypothetical protein GTU68_029156 [Idotea baltica]|nr:hypothetical protein [Idotea baltica]